jgi:hypothetical protein
VLTSSLYSSDFACALMVVVVHGLVMELCMVFTGYVDALMALLFVSGEDDLTAFRSVFSDIKIPANLSASHEKPSIKEAIDRHMKRFSK